MKGSAPRTLIWIATVVFVAIHFASPSGQRQIFRGGTNLVILDAYPRRNGRIVEGLKASDFEVTEDGKPQVVDQFQFVRIEPGPFVDGPEGMSEADDPMHRVFVAYLDTYHVAFTGSRAVAGPLVDYFQRIMTLNDMFGVTTSKMVVQNVALFRRADQIEELLRRVWPWPGPQSLFPDDPIEESISDCFFSIDPKIVDTLIMRHREHQTLQTLAELTTFLGRIRQTRTVITVVSDGWVLYGPDGKLVEDYNLHQRGRPPITYTGGRLGVQTEPRGPRDPAMCNSLLQSLASIDDKQLLRHLVELANRSNVSYSIVNPEGLGVSVVRDPRIDSLMTLAGATGGLSVVNTNDLRSGMLRIVNDQSAYYVLGYYSTNGAADGRYRQIKVRVKQAGVSMNARNGYLAPSAADVAATAALNAAARAKAEEIPPDMNLALEALSRLDADVELFAYASGSADGETVNVVAELASGAMASGKWSKGADVQVSVVGDGGEAVGAATARIEAGSRASLIRVPLKERAAVLRVSVRIAGEAGVRTAREVVRTDTGELLGEPLAFRGTPSAQSLLRPVADFLFRRTERVHVEWPLLKALDKRDVRLLDQSGKPLPAAPITTERQVDGHTVLAADLNLAPVAPGDYVLEIAVGSGPLSEQRMIAIRVER